jgi:hypothetical protein
MAKTTAIVGVWDHWGWAVLVTVKPDGVVVDRRRVTLIGDGLPPFPHHQEGQTLPRESGVALVKRVRTSVQRCARAVIDTLAGEVPIPIRGIAIRRCPELPSTIAERIRSRNFHKAKVVRSNRIGGAGPVSAGPRTLLDAPPSRGLATI